MTRASIIICTCNRPEGLRRTLAAIGSLRIPEDMSAEVIIVDNASSDETKAVVQDCDFGNLSVKYVTEEHQGKSWALNHGIAEATGDILVFTDDDVIPAHDWLVKLCAPIIAGTAEAVVGSVRLAAHLIRPWMTDTHRAWLADTDTLDRTNPERMVGANMAFSRTVMQKIPAFDIELGPGALGFGEETLYSDQLRLAGYRITTAFDAKVEHHFDENRLTPGLWMETAKKLGRIDAYMAHHWAHDTWPHPRRLVCAAWLQYVRRYLPYVIERSDPGAVPLCLLNAMRHLYACIHYLEVRKKPRNYEKYGLVRLSGTGSDPARRTSNQTCNTLQQTTQASIIICTHNRAANLRRTLAAIGNLNIPAGMTVEMIVVDNGSSDGTAEVVGKCKLDNVNLKYVSEPIKGQTRARNRGMAESFGEIIIFTDDDVIPAPDWVVKLCAPIIAGTADAVVGCVRLAAHLNRPWMTDTHRSWLAGTDTLDCTNPDRLVGANMAFSRSVLQKVPFFDVELGPGELGFGDETLFSRQLKFAGYRITTAFDAMVEHHFDENRLTPELWMEAAKKLGRVDAYMAHHWANETWPHPRWGACVAGLQYVRQYVPYVIRKPDSGAVPLCLLNAMRHLYARIHYLEVRKKPRNYEKYGLVRLSGTPAAVSREKTPISYCGNAGSVV